MASLRYTNAAASSSNAMIPMISPLIDSDGEPRRLIQIGEWKLTAWTEHQNEPRILDLDLATRLEYANPADIRKLIRRHRSEGNLNDVAFFATMAKNENGLGRPGTEYWLTEEQAIFIIAKSDTATANAILKEVIRVFMLARHGLLPSQALAPIIDPAQIAAIVAPIVAQAHTAAMAPMFAKLTALEVRMANIETTSAKALPIDGVIGSAVARTVVLSELVVIAEMVSGEKSRERAHQAARSRADAELRSALGWSGKARKWANLPQVRIGEATVKLQEMKARAVDVAKARKASEMPLFERFKAN